MKWGGFDYGSFKAMYERLDKAVREQRVEQMVQQVLQELGDILLRDVKRKTPVDTGHLRRNWYLSKVEKHGEWYDVTVYNNVEYAPYVENGHRIVVKGVTVGFVDGVYMLRIAADELERRMPQLVERKAQDMLLRIFGGK